MKYLTERDQKLLFNIAKYGAVDYNFARKIIYKTKSRSIPIRRLKRFKKLNIVYDRLLESNRRCLRLNMDKLDEICLLLGRSKQEVKYIHGFMNHHKLNHSQHFHYRYTDRYHRYLHPQS